MHTVKFRRQSLCFLVAILLLHCFHASSAKKLECYVDENEPKDDPNNIYKCNLSAKCCREEGKPSCCEEKDPEVARWEQFQLWGTLTGFVLLVAFVMFCCRHDGDFCWNRKDGGRYKYCCCGPIIYREGKEPPETEKKNSKEDSDTEGSYDSDYDEEKGEKRKEDKMEKNMEDKMEDKMDHPKEPPPSYEESLPPNEHLNLEGVV